MSVSQVKSAVRVLEILDYFERIRSPRSLKEICSALGYPQSSGTMLLKNMRSLGYLQYDRGSRQYLPTLKVATLGNWINPGLFAETRVLELADELLEETGESVCISLQNDVYLQYLKVAQADHPPRFHTQEGGMRPLTQTASGWMLLTSHKNPEAETLIRRSNIVTPIKEERQPVDLMKTRVREARAQGYAYAENLPISGCASMCMLAPRPMQGRSIAVAVGGPIERIRPKKDRLLQLLRSHTEVLVS